MLTCHVLAENNNQDLHTSILPSQPAPCSCLDCNQEKKIEIAMARENKMTLILTQLLCRLQASLHSASAA
jgi:hypothetical protein